MLTFSNGASAPCRADNWEQVQRACKRNAFRLPPKTVDAVIAEQPGAAVALVELIYEHLTQKKLTRPEDVRARGPLLPIAAPGPSMRRRPRRS